MEQGAHPSFEDSYPEEWADSLRHISALRHRYESLTPREREVMALVERGQLNKQVGGELGISEVTVKAHRGRMMQKMAAGSLAELVNMAARLGHATAGHKAS